ncbi:MAG: type II toxin-antitoxin system VapB family antitoxin [Kineosporiaceae bacterium]
MRTTVTIDDQLLKRARERALRSGTTLGSVVEDALRLLLAEHQHPRQQVSVELPVYGGSGLRPGVDLGDREALAELLDDPVI